MTLTYGPDSGARSVTLVYADVQQFLKNLRKKWPCRFICASEYGSKKGRAHHHIVLFWKGEYPDFGKEYKKFLQKWSKNKTMPDIYKQGNCFNWSPWSWGHIHFESGIAHEKFAYAMKYTFKDINQRSTKNELRMSLKPILGWEYFDALAQEYVDNGVKPSHWNYWFREIKDKYGKIRKYYMTRTLKQRFKEAVQKKWKNKYNEELQCDLFDYNSDDIKVSKQYSWPHLGTPWGVHIPEEIQGMWPVDLKKVKYASEWRFEPVDVVRGKYHGIDVEVATDKKGTSVHYKNKKGKRECFDVSLKEKAHVLGALKEQRQKKYKPSGKQTIR